MSDFRPYSKEMQIGKKKEKVKKVKQYKPIQSRKPIKKKRETPRKKDKTRTHIASGEKKPSLYQRGYFGDDYDKMYEEHGQVCGERIVSSYLDGVPPCSGGLEAHHVKFKSGQGRGTWRNGRPLCNAHHRFAHANFWYAEKWRVIHEEKYGEHYFKDEWDLYKEGLITEPTKEAFESYMESFERKTNWGL
jgi:hypothetical protein